MEIINEQKHRIGHNCDEVIKQKNKNNLICNIDECSDLLEYKIDKYLINNKMLPYDELIKFINQISYYRKYMFTLDPIQEDDDYKEFQKFGRGDFNFDVQLNRKSFNKMSLNKLFI
jgi:hypothetical protein